MATGEENPTIFTPSSVAWPECDFCAGPFGEQVFTSHFFGGQFCSNRCLNAAMRRRQQGG